MRAPRLPAAIVLATLVSACGPARATPSEGPTEEERVPTGYSSDRRATSTAAVSSLSGEDVPSGTTLADMLDRVPGVDVTRLGGADFSVRIRGARSLSGSSEPLYVVDGQPRTPAALDAIIPSSIVRIDVLKDAATLAAYGARGANGVVVITTLDAP